jgi:hypothetical protein
MPRVPEMVDFDKARQIAFEELSKIYTIDKISEKDKLGFEKYIEVWKVISEVEIFHRDVRDFTFFLCFKADFPISIPKIYISEADYEIIKYIPHIDTDRLICTFDSDAIRTDINRPQAIVYDALKRAKKVIVDGINKTNFSDFEDEFIAYWKNSYSKQDHIFYRCLSLIDPYEQINESDIKVTAIPSPGVRYNYIIHCDTVDSKRFISSLYSHYNNVTTHPVYWGGELEIPDVPPFNLSYDKLASLLIAGDDKKQGKLKRFLKSKYSPKIVLFKKRVGDKTLLLCFSYCDLALDKKGFFHWEEHHLKDIKKDNVNMVVRFAPEIYSQKRLIERSAGVYTESSQLTFLVAGLGSVGSNLIYFLNSFGGPNYRLVDIDVLSLENIGRHLLGYYYVNCPDKTEAMKEYLLRQRPGQNVEIRNESIVAIVRNDGRFVNEVDYIFIAVGNDNVESWLGTSLDEKLIQKPMFFLWVEPYLASGHCLYLHPNGSKKYAEYFDEDGLCKFNVIEKSEYLNGNEKLKLKEAGCQTSYTPYSSANLILFLSNIFPYINDVICNRRSESFLFDMDR